MNIIYWFVGSSTGIASSNLIDHGNWAVLYTSSSDASSRKPLRVKGQRRKGVGAPTKRSVVGRSPCQPLQCCSHGREIYFPCKLPIEIPYCNSGVGSAENAKNKNSRCPDQMTGGNKRLAESAQLPEYHVYIYIYIFFFAFFDLTLLNIVAFPEARGIIGHCMFHLGGPAGYGCDLVRI